MKDCTVADLGLDVGAYYTIAAPSYDEQRFGNSYGFFLDSLERDGLRKWLPASGRILEVGCGTGRLLDLATDGIDRCEEMLAIARTRHPNRQVLRASGTELPFEDGKFDAVFSMHVLMHLPKPEIARILGDCHRVLRPGGSLIFDVPSQPRRNLTGFRPSSWHCGTAFSPEELKILCCRFRWLGLRGLLSIPIHRIPRPLRNVLRPLDSALGRSPLRRWSSYFLVHLEKSP